MSETLRAPAIGDGVVVVSLEVEYVLAQVRSGSPASASEHHCVCDVHLGDDIGLNMCASVCPLDEERLPSSSIRSSMVAAFM